MNIWKHKITPLMQKMPVCVCALNNLVDGDSISLDGEEKKIEIRGEFPPCHDNLRFLLDIDLEMAS